MKEFLHKLKRKIKKIYVKYFTVEHFETFILSDKQFLKKLYKAKLGENLDLRNPLTFTEKMNWLKLYDRRPEYTLMADKYAVREYIAGKIGEEYLVPLLGVWDNADDIDFSLLPEKFVLKCNHNSDVVICTDKSTINEKEVKDKLNKQLKDNYYLHKREWPYKNIPRKIICEKYMENTNGEELFDYKLFCFNGEVKLIQLNSGRFSGDFRADHYDINWKHTDLVIGKYPMRGDIFSKPPCFEEMVDIASKLSLGIPHLRVDFNYWDNKLYFGELTFFESAGFMKMSPESWDELLGSWIELPKKRRR